MVLCAVPCYMVRGQVRQYEARKQNTTLNHLHEARVGDNLLGTDDINEWLTDSDLANAAHVKAVHTVPPYTTVNIPLILSNTLITTKVTTRHWGSLWCSAQLPS